MVATLSVFVGSLTGIVFLLILKAWEARRERVFLPRMRAHMDRGASAIKARIETLEARIADLPSVLTYILMRVLALTSVSFARWARAASEAAHRLADFISHKHNFERRELRSEFLKTMIEHKNGLAQPIMGAIKKRRTRKTTEKVQTSAPLADEVHQ